MLDPQSSGLKESGLLYTMLVLVIDVPIMPVMFFLAGYFAMPSLKKRGPGAFLGDKFIHIGLPWIFGAVLLAPLVVYMVYFSRRVPMGYLQFWATDFWTVLYQQSVYWWLFLEFGLLAWAYAASSRLQNSVPRVEIPSRKTLAILAGAMFVPFWLLNYFYPVDYWSGNLVLLYQPARVPLYLGYFALGIYAQQRGWFSAQGYRPPLAPWVLTSLLTGLGYLAWRMQMNSVPESLHPLKVLLTATLFNAFCFSALFALVAIFWAKANRDTPFWRSQADCSYGIYYLHPLVLFWIVYLLIPLPVSIYIKAPLAILITYGICWPFTAWILKKLPLLRDIF